MVVLKIEMGDSTLISVDQVVMYSQSLTEPSSLLEVGVSCGIEMVSGFSLGFCVCWLWF